MDETTAATETTPSETVEEAQDTAQEVTTTEAEQDTTEAAEGAESLTEDTQEATPMTIPIRFNHETRELSVEEAASLAQKALQSESVMSKLRFLAVASNVSVNQLIEQLTQAQDNILRDEIVQKSGTENEEIINQLVELEKQKHSKAYADMLAAETEQESKEREDVNKRLASDYLALRSEFPDLQEFDKVPKKVVECAVKNGTSLLHEYLAYQHKESKKVAAAQAVQKQNEKSSVGAQVNTDSNGSDPTITALKAAIWG